MTCRLAILIPFLALSAAGFVLSTTATAQNAGALPNMPQADPQPAAPSSAGPDRAAADRELPAITPGPPLRLGDALIAADRRNLTLAAARLEIDKAEGQLAQAYALILPGAQSRMQVMHRDHEDTVDFSASLPESMKTPGMGGKMVIMPQNDLKASSRSACPW